jgi:hypothetical protein
VKHQDNTDTSGDRQPEQAALGSGPDPEPTLHAVTCTVCSLCLEGAGGECHTPGCVFIYHDGPAPKTRGATLRQLLTEVGTVDGRTEPVAMRPGWYWYEQEYSEEGGWGPFDSKDAALRDADKRHGCEPGDPLPTVATFEVKREATP